MTLLERGTYLPQEPENWSVEAVFGNQRYVPEETWLDKNGTAFRPGTYYYVGGSSVLDRARHLLHLYRFVRGRRDSPPGADTSASGNPSCVVRVHWPETGLGWPPEIC